MSLTVRAARRLARPPTTCSVLSRRTYASGHDDHHHEQDTTDYGKEPGFWTPAWRKTVLAGAAITATILYAPESSEDAYITRWIAMYKTPSEVWSQINDKHTALVVDAAKEHLLFTTAERPAIHRLEFPQSFEVASPFGVPVGLKSDVSNVKVKGGPPPKGYE